MISLTSPVRTRAHGWPAGAKLLALCLATLVLFLIENPVLHLAVLALVLLAYRLPGPVFFRAGMSRLWILWPFVVVVLIWHMLTDEPVTGMVIVLRMVSVVGLANLVTMTTRLTEMTDLIHRLLAPLRRLGLRTDALELAMALVIRATPALLDKGHNLRDAWRARTHRRPSWRIVLPFTLLAIDDAEHLAEALRARGAITNERE
ncbi:energy-coupling factor transporter transmembrane component T family protein [Paracoccus lutimaris]|uniref:Biotin transport system permease protein n=1 Tax=Paracoccus lutimaris TaxID=1490030 RepID=A0A368YPE9_9RHOB|nr:energy-coupling factor transporter transmembrane protein EcfT [Paracoccus lutimaris]RCW80777.1 biotin transport system permease protein [Paracoccus lutimaris]